MQLIAAQLSSELMEVAVKSQAMMSLSSLYKQHLVFTTSPISVETVNQ